MIRFCCFLALPLLLLSACNKTAPKEDVAYTYQVGRLKHAYLNLGNKLTFDAKHTADDLRLRVNNFVGVQSVPAFNNVKNAWRAAYSDYNLLGPFIWAEGGLTNVLHTTRANLNSSPINPAFLDYTAADANSGIVNNPAGFPQITLANVRSWNQQGGLLNLTLGFHAIEFLVWGEDNSLSAPGARLVTDFYGNSGAFLRRKQLLQFSTIALCEDLEPVSFDGTFGTGLLEMPSMEAFDYMFNGLLLFIRDDFAEKTVHRPYLSQLQSDEVSTFSDNTILDLADKVHAIELFLDPEELFPAGDNDYYLIDFIQEISPEAYTAVNNELAALKADLNVLFGDFDAAVMEGSAYRDDVLQLYTDLLALHTTLSDFAAKVKG